MSANPIPDPSQQPITAADPRVAKILALIRANASPVAPDPSVPQTAQIAPVPVPQLQPTQSPIQQVMQQANNQTAAPPAPSASPMQGPAPTIDPPAQPDVTPQPGPIKSFLQSLVSGLGGAAYQGTQGALQRLGIPTDYEKQQNALKIGLQQQQANSLEGLRSDEAARYAAQAAATTAGNQPYTFGTDASIPVSLRGQTMPFAAAQALQKVLVQNTGKEDVANIAANAGAVTLTPEYAKRLGIPQLAGQVVGGKQLGSLNKMLQGTGANIMEGDIGGGHVGLIDKDSQKILADYGPSQRIIGAGMNAANRTVQVVNPNDPNSTIQMSPGQANAIGAQGTQSVGYQANKAVTRYFTSGEGAKNLNAFNTATAHLQQLGTVADALGNGDIQVFNKLGQNYAQQTGGTAPTNFDAVKTAVAGEIGKVFKGGNATDQEISEMNSTINRTQSPEQLKGVIQTYTALMNSKRDALQQQFTQGKQGNPNFPTAPASSSPNGSHPFFSKFGGVTK